MNRQIRGSLPIILCFSVFLLLGLTLHLVLPDKPYSENENRYLAQLPQFSFRALFSGDFTDGFEAYITDQFPFRDRWLDLKSRAERAAGKTENNGIFLCGKDTLITRFEEPSAVSVEAAVRAVNSLKANTGLPVTLAIVPTAAEIWRSRLPAHANSADQSALLSALNSGCEALDADISGALSRHADEPIFYRTDHHWTTLGAYYGYAAIAEAMGLSPQPKESFTPAAVSSDFYGTVYSSSGVRWVPPDRIEVWVPDDGVTLIRYDSPEGAVSPVYDADRLEVKDKYSYFLGGNTSRLVLSTGHEGGKLLVLRDSYADCALPFFFAHFSEIHVLDLRYYRQSVSAYAAEQGFDSVLILYSLADFVTDTSVQLMGT